MCFEKLKSYITADMTKSHNRGEYAKSVFNNLLDRAHENETYVSIALPIANYAVDHLTLTPKTFVTKLESYVKDHIVNINGTITIQIDKALEKKYPSDDTIGSKLTVLACEFVEDNKK